MSEKNYRKKLEFQKKTIARQLEQIKGLKSQNEKLKLELEKKEEIINSVESMRIEMAENLKEQKRLKEDYKRLIQQLKHMKSIIDKDVYKNRWWLIKLLIK